MCYKIQLRLNSCRLVGYGCIRPKKEKLKVRFPFPILEFFGSFVVALKHMASLQNSDDGNVLHSLSLSFSLRVKFLSLIDSMF